MNSIRKRKVETEEESIAKYKTFLKFLFTDNIKYSAKKVEYLIKDLKYFNWARTTAKYNPKANLETLEKVGDKFLANCITMVIKEQFQTEKGEEIKASQLSYISDYFSNNQTLSRIADYLGITKFVKGEITEIKISADVIEAFIAAIFYTTKDATKDMGEAFNNVFFFVETIFSTHDFKIDFKDENKYKSDITKIHEYYTPEEVELKLESEAGEFIATYSIQGKRSFEGRSSDKKEAKRLAAKKAIENAPEGFETRIQEKKSEKSLTEKGYTVVKSEDPDIFKIRIGDEELQMMLINSIRNFTEESLVRILLQGKKDKEKELFLKKRTGK